MSDDEGILEGAFLSAQNTTAVVPFVVSPERS